MTSIIDWSQLESVVLMPKQDNLGYNFVETRFLGPIGLEEQAIEFTLWNFHFLNDMTRADSESAAHYSPESVIKSLVFKNSCD